MKIKKLLIGCSTLMTISLITGCSTTSNSDLDSNIEITVISDEELTKNTREVTEALPDISKEDVNESFDGQPTFAMMGEVTAINGSTISIIPDISTNGATLSDKTNTNASDSTSSTSDDIMPEQTLTVTDGTIVNFKTDSEILSASLSDISIGNIVSYNYTLSEAGEEILSNITIIDTAIDTTISTK